MKIILTGTQAYGPVTEDSDYDLVMCYWDVDRVRDLLEDAGIEVQENSDINPVYKGFSFKLGSKTIQFIAANNDEDLDAWKEATRQMMLRELIEDREERIRTFQKLYRRNRT